MFIILRRDGGERNRHTDGKTRAHWVEIMVKTEAYQVAQICSIRRDRQPKVSPSHQMMIKTEVELQVCAGCGESWSFLFWVEFRFVVPTSSVVFFLFISNTVIVVEWVSPKINPNFISTNTNPESF